MSPAHSVSPTRSGGWKGQRFSFTLLTACLISDTITPLHSSVIWRHPWKRSRALHWKTAQRAALDRVPWIRGLLGAPLRQIVKNAGVTTGAFYGYFSSKEALFASIVEPHAAALMGRFMQAQTTFAELPEPEQPQHMGLESSSCIRWMVEYICDHREPVKLAADQSRGNKL